MAGYIIRKSPMGTPRLRALGTLSSNVPAAIDLRASIGGVSSKSEIESALPMAMPMAMLDEDEHGQQAEVLELREQTAGGHGPSSGVGVTMASTSSAASPSRR